jgi:phosphatidylglycerol:prolipoprotein diacylglycerol transferase
MFPILVEIAGIKIYSYGFFIALGYLATLALGRFLAKARGLDPSPFMDIAFIAIVSGVLGARLLFVLQNLSFYLEHPKEIFDFWNGGLVFYGGFLLGGPCGLLYGVRKKMPLWLSADISTAGLALAHAFGRVGCFAAGCCYGNYCPYPWAVHNDTDFVDPLLKGKPLHPVQLYESFLLFMLAGLMAWLIYKRKLANGLVALLYLTGYAGIRFITEIFRGDSDRGFVLGGWLSLSQGIALALFILGSGVLVRRLRSQNL